MYPLAWGRPRDCGTADLDEKLMIDKCTCRKWSPRAPGMGRTKGLISLDFVNVNNKNNKDLGYDYL